MGTTAARTFITRANLSRQLPTAMSIVSPNILYRLCEYAMTCRGTKENKAQIGQKKKQKRQTRTNLRVSSANIQHCWVVGSRDESTHLNVSDAVVDSEQRLPPKLCNRTSHQRHRHQRGPHPWAWRTGWKHMKRKEWSPSSLPSSKRALISRHL